MIKTLSEKIGECNYFVWREALYLPRWGVSVFPETGVVLFNIIRTAKKLEQIRDFFNKPLIITSWYRPRRYNELIGGAKQSQHIQGLAVDFMINGISSDDIRKSLATELKRLNIRMESIKTPHVHIDLKCELDDSNEKRLFMP